MEQGVGQIKRRLVLLIQGGGMALCCDHMLWLSYYLKMVSSALE